MLAVMGEETEQRLAGGAVTEVVRVGDTVRRSPGANTPFVRRLLARFEAARWSGAPRHLGVDGKGREILAFIEGRCGSEDEALAHRCSDTHLAAHARLLRTAHDLTARTGLAGQAEVVCHNDLAPRNTIYDAAGAPIAFIDWDLAAPGRRIEDVAHAAWQFLPLAPNATDLPAVCHRLSVFVDAYGLADRGDLLDTVLWWQDRCWRGIEAKAAAGDPAMVRLRDRGAARDMRAHHAWTLRHRAALDAALK
jgi:hypothetical protein